MSIVSKVYADQARTLACHIEKHHLGDQYVRDSTWRDFNLEISESGILMSPEEKEWIWQKIGPKLIADFRDEIIDKIAIQLLEQHPKQTIHDMYISHEFFLRANNVFKEDEKSPTLSGQYAKDCQKFLEVKKSSTFDDLIVKEWEVFRRVLRDTIFENCPPMTD